jgi:signal transduction histidine kinase
LPPPELIVVAEDLGAFDWKNFQCQVDLEIIRRVVWKLVMNAIKATRRGLISITISRKLPNESRESGSSLESLQIEVQDTGTGMQKKFVEGECSI